MIARASETRRVVVLGAGGMLGRAVVDELRRAEDEVLALTRAAADVTDTAEVARHIRTDDLVVNCAAYTDVDGAESDEATATEVNGHAVGRLADLCREREALLVHYGTDYVFDGRASTPYRVDATRAPINAYGRSKAVGEERLEASGCDFLLIRTSWVYAPWGENFVLSMLRLMRERDALRVVDDQRGRPTSALWLAEATRRLVDARARGVFHVADDGECTRYGLARCIAQLTNADCDVRPCTSREFPSPAERPAYSVLDLTRLRSVLGPLPSFETNVARLLSSDD